MCIFSAHVTSVADTKIFARASTGGRQFLVYAMQYEAGSELAMILPLPAPPASPEDAVRFIDLSGYAEFFDDLAKGFILPQPARLPHGRAPTEFLTLTVHQVGSFEASFVPRLQDFARLDRRFRLPEQTWDKLPQYADYGFAVFKLKAGAQKIHPMAFEFPRRNQDELFYPTVHIHDGQAEARARFDHVLYCQTAQRQDGWLVSSAELPALHPTPAGRFMDVERAQGIIDPDAFVQMKNLYGMQVNQDIMLPEGNHRPTEKPNMTPTNNHTNPPPANQEDEKALKSLRSLTSMITLGAILGVGVGLFMIWSILAYGFDVLLLLSTLVAFVIAGMLFWGSRLLVRRKKAGFVVYTWLVVISVCSTLILRILFSRQPQQIFTITDLASFIVPAIIIFELYKLVKKGLLT